MYISFHYIEEEQDDAIANIANEAERAVLPSQSATGRFQKCI